MCVIKRATV